MLYLEWPDPGFKVMIQIKGDYFKMAHGYYRMLIGNQRQTIEWYQFRWPWVTPDTDFMVAVFLKLTLINKYAKNGARWSHSYYGPLLLGCVQTKACDATVCMNRSYLWHCCILGCLHCQRYTVHISDTIAMSQLLQVVEWSQSRDRLSEVHAVKVGRLAVETQQRGQIAVNCTIQKHVASWSYIQHGQAISKNYEVSPK